MAENHTVKPGTLLHTEAGRYSDRSTIGWFVCVQEFCPENLVTEYVTANPDEYFDNYKFMAFVLSKGVIAEVAEFFDEWHLTDYGYIKEIEFRPRLGPEDGK